MVGLVLGLLIGAPTGFTYAVARRSRSDREKARELVKQLDREARGATLGTMGWFGIGVVLVVIAFACVFGAAGRDRAGPDACVRASRGPAAAGPASRQPAGRLAAAEVSPTACRR